MRKGDDGGEKKKTGKKRGKKKKKKKKKTFLVATNVVASRPPERQLTATPTARANSKRHTYPSPELVRFTTHFEVFTKTLLDPFNSLLLHIGVVSNYDPILRKCDSSCII